MEANDFTNHLSHTQSGIRQDPSQSELDWNLRFPGWILSARKIGRTADVALSQQQLGHFNSFHLNVQHGKQAFRVPSRPAGRVVLLPQSKARLKSVL